MAQGELDGRRATRGVPEQNNLGHLEVVQQRRKGVRLGGRCRPLRQGGPEVAEKGRSETGSFIGMRPGLEPQNADTLRDRFARHSQCLCRGAEDVDHVYRQIDVVRGRVDPRTRISPPRGFNGMIWYDCNSR